MYARELFENIRCERREIKELTERIEKIETRAGAKSILPQPVIVHTNKTGSLVEEVAIEAAELQEELIKRKERLTKDIQTAEQIISQIRCSEYRRVITAYYLTGEKRKRMDEIAHQIPCSESTAWRCFRKGMRVAEEIYKADSK